MAIVSRPIEVVITGLGVVSALGQTTLENWQRLLQGQSAIALQQPFLSLSPRPLALIHPSPIPLATLTQQVVASAIADAKLAAPLPNCGVVIGSSRSHQAQWEQWAIAQRQSDASNTSDPSLSHWLETLPHSPAIATARQIQTQGPVLAPMAACATGLWAIAQAFELIQTGQCQRVIAGAVEAPITPLTLAGFEKMGALATTGCYPFDQRREGLVLGEGGAIFVLESAASAAQRSASIYGRILGVGLTADGYHVSAPNPRQSAAIAAVQHCLQRSERSPSDIGFIHAHGTSTQLNDRNEAHLIQQCFPSDIAVSSTKGATGHTLGASGALGIAFGLLALRHQILPPCIGLQDSDFSLNFIRQAQPACLKTLLCFSFGFGGQNAVVALRQ